MKSRGVTASPRWRPNPEIAWHPDRGESTRGTSLGQRDSKLSHEFETSGQQVQDGAHAKLKSIIFGTHLC